MSAVFFAFFLLMLCCLLRQVSSVTSKHRVKQKPTRLNTYSHACVLNKLPTGAGRRVHRGRGGAGALRTASARAFLNPKTLKSCPACREEVSAGAGQRGNQGRGGAGALKRGQVLLGGLSAALVRMVLVLLPVTRVLMCFPCLASDLSFALWCWQIAMQSRAACCGCALFCLEPGVYHSTLLGASSWQH